VLLSVAAGAATAKQAASVAMAADAAGRIAGLVVVDPDANDRTPGRLSGLVRRSRGTGLHEADGKAVRR
jgi:hypothetical protein